MKNLDYITNNFEEIGMFQKIDEQQIKILNKHDTLYSFRKDGFCQRIFSYLNCLRISKKLNKKLLFCGIQVKILLIRLYMDTRSMIILFIKICQSDM